MKSRKSKVIRILLAKVGLDGHDRGIKFIARVLKDSGFEVIYTGLHKSPEEIVRASLQEDVDGIGVSVLSGAHIEIFSRIIKLMKKYKIEDKILFAGGIIPTEDIDKLKKIGVAEIFIPGATSIDIIKFLKNAI